ncbi:cct motif family protein [Stylonychia lemnae]|uniref:Cct motif family protein n=1 Tax=Stylonychia lemnae TaxID=5949 RepID=A0A078AKS9_STYLE|nr:cct motif family protein [Stylonychia lemnae]|eukprot:CDW82980.1 cct motif family protein [Stylonychia lemnae]
MRRENFIRHPHYPEIIKFKIGSVKTISTLSNSNNDDDFNTFERLSMNGDGFHNNQDNSSTCGDLEKLGCLFTSNPKNNNFDKMYYDIEDQQPSFEDDFQQSSLNTFNKLNNSLLSPSSKNNINQQNMINQNFHNAHHQYQTNLNNSGYQNSNFSPNMQTWHQQNSNFNEQNSIYQCQNEYDVQQMSYYHQNFQEQLREKIDVPNQQQQYVSSNQLLQSTLRKLDRIGFSKGTFTCSTKSAYSFKEDILSEEQDGDDEDSIQQADAIMDEQDELDEIQSDTGSAVFPNADTRSVQGDLEMEAPSYYCFFCRKPHNQNGFESYPCQDQLSQFSHIQTQQQTFQSPQQQNYNQTQKAFMKKVAKLNYQNLKLIQESQEEECFNHFKHTTTFTTTTTATKSSCCGSECQQRSSQKKTIRTLIMEDQMSTCSCGRKSIKGSECGGSIYGGQGSYAGKDLIKSSNLSDLSSLNEFQEMSWTLSVPNGQGFHVPQNLNFKKGPSSINSVKTSIASCKGNISVQDSYSSQLNTSVNKNVRFQIEDDEELYQKQKATLENQMNQTMQRRWFVDKSGYVKTQSQCYVKRHKTPETSPALEVYPRIIKGLKQKVKKSGETPVQNILRRSNRNLRLKFGNKLQDQDGLFRLTLRKTALDLDEIEDNYQGEESSLESFHTNRNSSINSRGQQIPEESPPQEIKIKQINRIQRELEHKEGMNQDQMSNYLNKGQLQQSNLRIRQNKFFRDHQAQHTFQIPIIKEIRQNNSDEFNSLKHAHSNSSNQSNHQFTSANQSQLQNGNQQINDQQQVKNIMIGNLSINERFQKVRAFWEKRKRKSLEKQTKYAKKKKQADKKLRINGRFVSLKQAKNVLNMTKKEFQKAIKQEGAKNLDSKKIKKKRKIDAQVIRPDIKKIIKLSNAQEILKVKKRKTQKAKKNGVNG